MSRMSSGGDRRGLLRLAYAVPTERLGPATLFSLRLPDGYRIELPEPTPGDSGTEPEDGQRWDDAEPASEHRDSSEPDDGAAGRIIELEQELGELRSADAELQRRLAELTAEHEQAGVAAARADEELKSLRGLYGAVEEELRSTRQSLAQALSELDLAHTERDAARQAAESALSRPRHRTPGRRVRPKPNATPPNRRPSPLWPSAMPRAGTPSPPGPNATTARQAAESAHADRDTAQEAAELRPSRTRRGRPGGPGEPRRTRRGAGDDSEKIRPSTPASRPARANSEARIELLRADATSGRSERRPAPAPARIRA